MSANRVGMATKKAQTQLTLESNICFDELVHVEELIFLSC